MDMIMDLMESGDECSYELSSVKFLMLGKEVGTIIGKGGETIKRMREETGANVHITNGSSAERIVTVSGKIKSVYMAFNFICEKCHEAQVRNMGANAGDNAVSISMRMIVAAKQCGIIIGKQGVKIKEIRQKSGASIQVASEMLPDSTERAVTMTGSVDDVTCCMILVCQAIKGSPAAANDRIEYVPKGMNDGGPGGMFGGGNRGGNGPGPAHFMPPTFGGMMARDMQGFDHPMNCPPKMGPMPGMMGGPGAGNMAGFGGAGGPMSGPGSGALGNATSVVSALAALAGSQLRGPQNRSSGAGGSGDGQDRNSRKPANTVTQEMSVANDMIGCIIGKAGSKIADIRKMTGSMITISKFDDSHEDGQSQMRVVTMKGTANQVALAEYLIGTSVEMHKANSMNQMSGENADDENVGDNNNSSDIDPSAIPLANLLKNPAALNALSSLTNMNIGCLAGLQEMLAGRGGSNMDFMSGGGGGGGNMNRKSYTSRMRQVPGGTSSPEDSKPRLKFQPY